MKEGLNPGDRVVLTKRPRFHGDKHPNLSAREWRKGDERVIQAGITYEEEGCTALVERDDGTGFWIDDDCFRPVLPPVTDGDVQAAIRSILGGAA